MPKSPTYECVGRRQEGMGWGRGVGVSLVDSYLDYLCVELYVAMYSQEPHNAGDKGACYLITVKLAGNITRESLWFVYLPGCST